MASSFAPQRVIISSTFVESGSSLFQLVPHSSAPTALLNLRAGSSPAPPNDEENHAALLRTEAVVADELSIASQTNSPVPEYDVELSSSARVVENGIPATRSLGRKAPPPGWLRRTLPDFPWHTVPNYLTYARCLAIPALIGIFYMPGKHVETAILFALASFTDYLDGYLARRWDISSSFGAFLDPVVRMWNILFYVVFPARGLQCNIGQNMRQSIARKTLSSAIKFDFYCVLWRSR